MHAGMDMDHGNMGHGDMDMGARCSMNVMTLPLMPYLVQFL